MKRYRSTHLSTDDVLEIADDAEISFDDSVEAGMPAAEEETLTTEPAAEAEQEEVELITEV